jgi:hypothetical protein
MDSQTNLEARLSSFDASARRGALRELAAAHRAALRPECENLNLHFHSFFSYNAENWSPSRIAWEARKAGLYAAGLCDFDVLDGLDEFLDAGVALGLRCAVHLETRAYVKELAHTDISSPGEPGVTYIMGAGFARAPAPGSAQAAGLTELRAGARTRNLALVDRINSRLRTIAVDYERDVLPLTPSGNATERHIISAYLNRVKTAYPGAEARTVFLADLLAKRPEEIAALLADTPAIEEALRNRLVKKGGIGYEAPSKDTFPPAERFTAWVTSCGAIPMVTWLDGTSGGEKDADALLDCMVGKGCAALNIIPDRNWNIKDPAARQTKRAHLQAIVKAAARRDLPVNTGTEMNKLGLPFVDDLAGEVLSAYRDAFRTGAAVMVGHTVLARYAGYGYLSEGARADFPAAADRNRFFAAVGALPALDLRTATDLAARGPAAALEWFRRAVQA